MPRCGCAGTSGCSCVVTGGNGIAVNGSGTGADPYVVDSIGTSITGAISVSDTATVDLTLGGSGSLADPYVLSADADLSLSDLQDAPAGTPATGDVMIWNGTDWVFGPPSSGGGGATVITGNGISGDGSIGAPVVLNPAGTWGTAPLDGFGANTTLGAPVYVDENGQVRSQPRGADFLAPGAGRPNHYPGRIIIQDGVTYYSNGTVWTPVGPVVEGPLTVESPRWSAAGLVLASGVTAGGASPNYAEFHRYGPIITMYLNRVAWTPSGGAVSSDITNQDLVTLPESMTGLFALSGAQVGSVGRLTNFMLSQGRVVSATAIAPNTTNTNTSQAWQRVETSFALTWQLDPSLDPAQAFASVRANAVPAAQAEIDRHQDD